MLLPFDRNSIGEIVKNIEDILEDCNRDSSKCDNFELIISSGSPEHWVNSISFALRNDGYIIWGLRKSDGRNIEMRIRRANDMLRRYFECYDVNKKPLLNVFYATNRKGVIGLGLIITIYIDEFTKFWEEERKGNKVIFDVRWVSKALMLHKSVLENPENPELWKGLELPGNIPVHSGWQPLTRLDLKQEIIKLILEHKGEFEFLIDRIKHETKRQVGVNEITKRLFIDESIVKSLISLLQGGHNVLIVGPPGVGKTTLARLVALSLGYEPYIATANASWSRFDVIGGMTLRGGSVEWKNGVLLKALIRHCKAKRRGLKGVVLVLDEVNRADVDKAFGEFLTIFSSPTPDSWVIPNDLIEEIRRIGGREADEFLKVVDDMECGFEYDEALGGYRIPGDFRIIATMNYTDVSNLFVIGEAFARRFTIIEVDYVKSKEGMEDEVKFLIERLKEEFNVDLVENAVRLIELERLVDVTLELRQGGVCYGTAHLYSFLKSLITTLSSRLNVDNRLIVRLFKASLGLSYYWDEEKRRIIENALSKLYE